MAFIDRYQRRKLAKETRRQQEEYQRTLDRLAFDQWQEQEDRIAELRRRGFRLCEFCGSAIDLEHKECDRCGSPAKICNQCMKRALIIKPAYPTRKEAFEYYCPYCGRSEPMKSLEEIL